MVSDQPVPPLRHHGRSPGPPRYRNPSGTTASGTLPVAWALSHMRSPPLPGSHKRRRCPRVSLDRHVAVAAVHSDVLRSIMGHSAAPQRQLGSECRLRHAAPALPSPVVAWMPSITHAHAHALKRLPRPQGMSPWQPRPRPQSRAPRLLVGSLVPVRVLQLHVRDIAHDFESLGHSHDGRRAHATRSYA